jgi:hypothetical protein
LGLAQLGAILTNAQGADFTVKLDQYPYTTLGSLTARPAPAGSDGGFYWYGINDSSTATPANSATLWQNNIEMSAGGMNMGVAIGRTIAHEFGHWALQIGPHQTARDATGTIMAEGAVGTFLNGSATLSADQIKGLQKRCNDLRGGGGGGGGAAGGGYGGIGLSPIYGVIGSAAEGWGYSYSWTIGVVGYNVFWVGPRRK